MSGADLLEDGFPHATPEGYKGGCRGSRCRGIEDYGWSCTYSMQRYRGDFEYRRWVDEGKSPEEIRAIEADRKVTAKAKRAIVEAPSMVMRTVADSVAPVHERVRPASVDAARRVGRPRKAPPSHGTYAMSQRGCGREQAAECPSALAGGKSCHEASLEYRRQNQAQRRAAQRAERHSRLRMGDPETTVKRHRDGSMTIMIRIPAVGS